MKKLSLLLAVVMVVCSFGAVTVFAAGGSGVEGDPYLISTAEDLLAMSENKSAYYKLAANIDLTDVTWTPFDFNGYLDGDNKEITNLVYESTSSNAGLFKTLKGTVENLIIRGSFTLTGEADMAGAIAAKAESSAVIKNCVNYADVSTRRYAAGIVGENKGILENCINYGTITTMSNNWNCAGIASSYNGGSISGCKNYGTINGGQDSVGGIVGSVGANLEITDCSNYGNVTGGWQRAAGIVAQAQSGGVKVSNCYNEGAITSNRYIGGIVGIANGITIENSINAGAVYGPSHSIGGIVGYIAGSETSVSAVNGCTNRGEIGKADSGANPIGGIVGELNNYAVVENCTNDGSVVSSSGVIGGIAGKATTSATVTKCYNNGSVTGANRGVGGIIGTSTTELPVSYCGNSGVISRNPSSGDNVGGIVGRLEKPTTIKDCYDVSESTTAGGIVGSVENDASNSSVINCYTYGTVSNTLHNWIGGTTVFNFVNVYSSNKTSNSNGATVLEDAAFTDGTVVALLNGNRTGDYAVWEQGESYPVIRSSFSIKAVTSAEIAGSTTTTVSYAVTLADEDATAKIIVALYNGDFLMAVKSVSADETSATFETTEGATLAKIFVWENLTTIKPIVMDEYEF